MTEAIKSTLSPSAHALVDKLNKLVISRVLSEPESAKFEVVMSSKSPATREPLPPGVLITSVKFCRLDVDAKVSSVPAAVKETEPLFDVVIVPVANFLRTV